MELINELTELLERTRKDRDHSNAMATAQRKVSKSTYQLIKDLEKLEQVQKGSNQ